jgi:hypothetical protein
MVTNMQMNGTVRLKIFFPQNSQIAKEIYK